MEIQVGEYVRVMGIITKLFKIESKRDKKTYYFDRKVLDGFNFLSQYGIDQLVRKHSFEIIDLIEKGDYVNGIEVVTIDGYDEDGNDKEELGILETYVDEVDGIYLTDVNIKSIVTKEQFKSMEYEVK